jgi:hypothetical protein
MEKFYTQSIRAVEKWSNSRAFRKDEYVENLSLRLLSIWSDNIKPGFKLYDRLFKKTSNNEVYEDFSIPISQFKSSLDSEEACYLERVVNHSPELNRNLQIKNLIKPYLSILDLDKKDFDENFARLANHIAESRRHNYLLAFTGATGITGVLVFLTQVIELVFK